MSQSIKTLGKFIKPTIFSEGSGALLPEAYKKFWKEWKETEPTAVHNILKQGMFERNEVTGEVKPIQDLPIPTIHVKEQDEQIWGGEGIVQGFIKRHPKKLRVPRFWIPVLKRSVVYSEILDKHISVVVTERAIRLINEHYGFDHYILKTPACDLKSLLALSFKRKMLQELQKNCPAYTDNAEKQEEVYNKYKQYLSSFTPEEIEWYGYSFLDACKKIEAIKKAEKQPIPLKQVYRAQLIEKLRAAGIKEAEEKVPETPGTWFNKINPFAKKHET